MRGLVADGAPMGVAAPVADGVAVVPGFANVIAFQTADGLVLVDTGLQQTARAMFDAVREQPAHRGLALPHPLGVFGECVHGTLR